MTSRYANINESAAAELRSELAVRKLSGRQLAGRMNGVVSPATIARLLSGESRISVGNVVTLAEALGLDPLELFARMLQRARYDETGEHIPTSAPDGGAHGEH